MNKRVPKPERRLPLIPDQDVTEAELEKFLRDHHDEIADALREAKAELDAGKGTEINSLEEFLVHVRGPSPKQG